MVLNRPRREDAPGTIAGSARRRPIRHRSGRPRSWPSRPVRSARAARPGRQPAPPAGTPRRNRQSRGSIGPSIFWWSSCNHFIEPLFLFPESSRHAAQIEPVPAGSRVPVELQTHLFGLTLKRIGDKVRLGLGDDVSLSCRWSRWHFRYNVPDVARTTICRLSLPVKKSAVRIVAVFFMSVRRAVLWEARARILIGHPPGQVEPRNKLSGLVPTRMRLPRSSWVSSRSSCHPSVSCAAAWRAAPVSW